MPGMAVSTGTTERKGIAHRVHHYDNERQPENQKIRHTVFRSQIHLYLLLAVVIVSIDQAAARWCSHVQRFSGIKDEKREKRREVGKMRVT